MLWVHAWETDLLQWRASPAPNGHCDEYTYLMEQAALYMKSSEQAIRKAFEDNDLPHTDSADKAA